MPQPYQTLSVCLVFVADLFCYPIFNIFEYNKKKDEYWRFEELTYPKLKELKVFPEESKKGLRFYN